MIFFLPNFVAAKMPLTSKLEDVPATHLGGFLLQLLLLLADEIPIGTTHVISASGLEILWLSELFGLVGINFHHDQATSGSGC